MAALSAELIIDVIRHKSTLTCCYYTKKSNQHQNISALCFDFYWQQKKMHLCIFQYDA